MKKIIKTLLVVMVLAVVLTAFTGCDAVETLKGIIPSELAAMIPPQLTCSVLGHKGAEHTPCERCGEVWMESNVSLECVLNGHKMVSVTQILPTCTEDGMTSGLVCSVCGHEDAPRKVLPATGHKMIPATCEVAEYCIYCRITGAEALGHTPVDVPAVAPTCSTPGHTAGTACELCDEILSGCEEIAIDPDAHYFVSGLCAICQKVFEYGVGDNTRVALDTLGVAQDGSLFELVYFAVTEAGHYKISGQNIITSIFTLDASGNTVFVNPLVDLNNPLTWGEAYLEPGYYVLGLNYYAGAGEYTFNIAKVDCTNTEEVTKAPTCTETGLKTTTCTVCGHVVEGVEVPAVGHSWADATCTTPKTCSVCSEVEGEALGHTFIDGACVLCKLAYVDPTVEWVLTTELKDGDQVLIGCPKYNKLLSAEKVSASSYYNKGVNYTTSDFSKVTDAEIFVVTVNSDGTYTFTSLTGKVIALADSYSSLNDTGKHKSWTLKSRNDGTFTVYNTGRKTYLEWYASKNNWSTYTAGNTAEYYLSFYVKNSNYVEGAEHVHNHISNVVAPTCTAAGSSTYTCACGDTYNGPEVAALGHTTENGVCDNCGHTFANGILTVLKNASLSFANKEQRTTFNTNQQVWEQNGIKMINDKDNSTNAIADYANPARFYQNSKVTVEAAGMTKVVITTGGSSYATALVNSAKTIAGATVTSSGNTVTITFAEAVDSFSFSCTAQIRVATIVVNP